MLFSTLLRLSALIFLPVLLVSSERTTSQQLIKTLKAKP